MNRLFRHYRALAALTLPATLVGCMVGPNYGGAPHVAPLAETTGIFPRAKVAPVNAGPPLAQWWAALNDETLNRIEALALANSPDVARARARIQAAHATVRDQQAQLLPQGGASATYVRARIPGSIGSASVGTDTDNTTGNGATQSDNNFNLYSLGADASWEIDLFGGTRRQIANARDSLQASEADLQDAQVSLTKNVATAYINLRSAQQRLILARQDTALRLRMLQITRVRRKFGTASDVDVENAISSLEQTQGTELPIVGQAEIYLDELAALVGQEPGTLDASLGTAAPLPLPPAATAIGNPAALLRRRPDIRAAERRLAAANETIGANVAQYFPQLSLLGVIGVGSTSTGSLFSSKSLAALGAPSLSWNIFNFPAIGAQVKQARAEYAEQQASYQTTVLQALRDANEALSRFGHQRDNVATLVDRNVSAERSAQIARMRNASGTVSTLTVLNAETDRVSAHDNLLQGQAELTSDWITLQSALGLGWQAPARAS